MQARSQPPQFAASFCVSRQDRAHAVSVEGQPHRPAMQSCVDPHACPHAPQLLTLLDKSTHDVPHAAMCAGHVATQAAATHTRPAAHALPQPPQFAPSIAMSAHESPQRTRPAGQ
jgi:hypothetical protein